MDKRRFLSMLYAKSEMADSISGPSENQSPEYFLPDSMVEKLYKAVCVTKGSKKKGRLTGTRKEPTIHNGQESKAG